MGLLILNSFYMAKKSLIVKAKKAQRVLTRAVKAGRKPKFPTKVYNRCGVCGRPRAYVGRFDMCRICLRQLAARGEIMGLKKASW
jgi:small subunit ribosomal protein S14